MRGYQLSRKTRTHKHTQRRVRTHSVSFANKRTNTHTSTPENVIAPHQHKSWRWHQRKQQQLSANMCKHTALYSEQCVRKQKPVLRYYILSYIPFLLPAPAISDHSVCVCVCACVCYLQHILPDSQHTLRNINQTVIIPAMTACKIRPHAHTSSGYFWFYRALNSLSLLTSYWRLA